MTLVKSLIMFLLAGIAAIWFGFFHLDKVAAFIFFKDYAYYFIEIAVLLWVFSLIKLFLNADAKTEEISLEKVSSSLKSFWSLHGTAICFAVFFMISGAILCKPDFRILADETNLLSASQTLYELKQPFVSLSVINHSNGEKDILTSTLDKRPLFFPYLVSKIHSIIGYNVGNIFFFNFLSSVLALFLLYYLIQIRFGRFWGICGMICLAAYPLFIVFSNSAGFEVFNLTCSLVLFLLSYVFLKKPDAIRGEVLLLWLPLISQSRYESVLALGIILPLFFYKLPKIEYSNLSYKFYCFPFLFLPVAWQRLVTDNAKGWQVDSLEESFGLKWLFINIEKAFEFFFAGIDNYGVIIIFSILACIGCYLVIRDFFVDSKSPIYKNMTISVFLFYLLHALARFIYSLVDLTEAGERRLGIIFLPVIVYLTIVVLVRISRFMKVHRVCYFILSLLLLSNYWPEAANLYCLKDYLVYHQFKFCREILNIHYPDKSDYIILSSRPNYYTPLGYNSVFYKDYYDSNDRIKQLINANANSFFIAIQRVDNGTMTVSSECQIPTDLHSEVIAEQKFDSNTVIRLSRCGFKKDKN